VIDVAEFMRRFKHLRDQGFILTKRKGPTGVGKTLEEALGLSENNIAAPDLGEIELKAHRLTSNSLITLFTFNRKVWLMPPLEAIKRYGVTDANGRLGLYYTLSTKPNSAGLLLGFTDDALRVQHHDGTVIAQWPFAAITEQFMRKLPALILVSATAEMRGNDEYFHYQRARLLQGTSSKVLLDQCQIGTILLDLRLHDANGYARNHGTAFRVSERNLPNLFQKVFEL
jgi:hypothetical protein